MHPTSRGGNCEGNPGERAQTLGYGRQSTGGGFRCQVLHRGVQCTVVSTGKGFLMGRNKVVAVGGASIRLAPLHLSEFLSPDRQAWARQLGPAAQGPRA